jgi:phospholipid/cholesterol/gamma-HCH transport system substrate-binding protein
VRAVITRRPSLAQVLVALAFALSCFGLALFLWTAFGGPVPLQAKGYRFHVDFNEATQLADQSDVRISGVSVGKVVNVGLAPNGLADATIQLDDQFAPIPQNTRAILRQKTLLGETYVELTPGSRNAASVPEDGRIPRAQVAPSVQLDEIFRTFDRPTRQSFREWMQQQAVALNGRGSDLNAALGELVPFTSSANKVLRVLDTQRQAVQQLVRGGAETFGAISQRQGELRSLIQHAATVFDTTARRNRELAHAVRILPTFEDESRRTLARLESFAANADPLVRQLRPAARQLTPTLRSTKRLAPHLQTFFAGLRQAIPVGVRGLPALRAVLGRDLPPLLRRLNPFLRQLDPIVTVLGNYRHEVTAFLGNVASATNAYNNPAEGHGRQVHYVRSTAPLGPHVLAALPHLLKVDRTNPYTAPLGYQNLVHDLDSFETRQCTGGIDATLDPATPSDPNFIARAGGTAATAADLFGRIQRFAFDGKTSTAQLPHPDCRQQPPFHSIGVSPELTRYLHVRRER